MIMVRARRGGWRGLHAATLEALEPRRLMVFDPSPNEQYMMELLNRMRMNPAAELGLLTTSLGNPARSSNGAVDGALQYFHTSGPALASQWQSLTPAQPLAWNERLYVAAEGHNGAMIGADEQTHQAPGEPALGDRATNAGYTGWSQVGENVYAFAEGVVHAHAGFALDWGNTANGIQDPPGHRDNMMESSYREVGIRIATPGRIAGHDVGPWVVTQDFGRRFSSGSFLVGVVFQDGSSDGYSPGEGLGGVTVRAVAGNGSAGAPEYTTTSMTAGGYQLQAPAGTYAVTFSGAGWGGAVTYFNVTINSENAKVDAKRGVPPPAPVIRVAGAGIVVANGDLSPQKPDGTDFGNANLTQQSITKTFTISNAGNQTLRLGNFTHVLIGGANASDFTLTMDAATTVAGGASTAFTITFDPSALGVRNATVTIQSSDPATPTYSFAILARGVNRPIAQVSGNQAAISPGDTSPTTADWTNFAGINAQHGQKVRIFTVSNVGLLGMTLGSGGPAVALSGSDAGLFSVFVQPTGTLAPGASSQFRVRFTPSGHVGFAYATITVRTNDPVTPLMTFAIRGTGLAQARMEVSSAGAPIAAGDSTPGAADKTDYGAVTTAGAANRVRLFTIRNTGLADLVLGGSQFVVTVGLNAADYFVSGQPIGGIVGVGQSVTFKVRFDPVALGTRSATVRIAANDPLLAGLGGAFEFAISGVGV